MLNKVREYIRKHQILDAKGLHIAALSGGADSVALLLILRELGYRVAAAHCNFHLRGDESNRDEEFVHELCEALSVPLHLSHFNTREYASLHHISIEMAARKLRYAWFEQLRNDIGADDICVAHHRDDSVETLLMNLIRGTGIHGLTGIRPVNGRVKRPLLCLSKEEIEQYLNTKGQTYVTDSTNLDDDALRNRVRHHLIPLLQNLNPQASANMARTAEHLTEAAKIYDAAIGERRNSVVSAAPDRITIDIDALKRAPSAPCLLHEIIRDYGFTPAQIDDIMGCEQSGKIFMSADYDLIIDRGQIIIEPRTGPMSPMTIPMEGTYALPGGSRLRVATEEVSELSDVRKLDEGKVSSKQEQSNLLELSSGRKLTEGKGVTTIVSKERNTATLDASAVTFPLVIRSAAAGDRFRPFGMHGSKLVSDYLTDRKVNVLDKRRARVVTDANGNIVWLVGERTDDRFRVKGTTRRVLRLSLDS